MTLVSKLFYTFLFCILSLTLSSQLNVNVSSTLATCPTNGSITVNISNGVPTFCYQIVGVTTTPVCIASNTYTFNNVGGGNYTIRVSDNSNPPLVKDVTVNVPTNYQAPNITAIVSGCTVVATATNGSTPYQYAVSGDAGITFGPLQSSNIFTITNQGNYTVKVVDACGSSSPFNIKVEPDFNIRQVSCLGTNLDSINIRVDLGGANINNVTTTVVYDNNDSLNLGAVGIASFPNKCGYKLVMSNACGFKLEQRNPCRPFPASMDFECLDLVQDSLKIKMQFQPIEILLSNSTKGRLIAVNGTDTIYANNDGTFNLPYRCDGWKVRLESTLCNSFLEVLVDSCTMEFNVLCNKCSTGEATVEVKGGKAPYKFYYSVNGMEFPNPNGINNPIYANIPPLCPDKKITYKVVDDCGKVKLSEVHCFEPLIRYDCKTKILNVTGAYGIRIPPFPRFPNYTIDCITCVPQKSITINSMGQLGGIELTDSVSISDRCGEKYTFKVGDPNEMVLVANPVPFSCKDYSISMVSGRKISPKCNVTVLYNNYKVQIFNKSNVLVNTLNSGQLWNDYISGEPYTLKVIDPGSCGTPSLNITPMSINSDPFTNIKLAVTSKLIGGQCNPIYRISFTGTSRGIIRYNANGTIKDTLIVSERFLLPGKYKILGECQDTTFTLGPITYPEITIKQPSCPNGDEVTILGVKDKAYWLNWGDTSKAPFPVNHTGDDNFTFDCVFNTTTCIFPTSNKVTGLAAGSTHTVYIFPTYLGQNITEYCAIDTFKFKVESTYVKMNKLNINFYSCVGGIGLATAEVIGGTTPYTITLKNKGCTNTISSATSTSGSNIVTFNNIQPGEYCFDVKDSCGNVVPFGIIKLDPSTFIIKYDTLCNTTSQTLQASKLPGAVYTWTNLSTGQVVVSSTNPWELKVSGLTQVTQFKLNVKFNACDIIDTIFNVSPNSNIDVTLSDTLRDCKLFLGATTIGGVQPVTLTWYNSSTAIDIKIDTINNGVNINGTYKLITIDGRGCKITKIFKSTYQPLVLNLVPKDSFKVKPDTTIQVNLTVTGGSNPYSFSWDNTTGFQPSSNTVQNPLIKIDSTYKAQKYTVTVTDNIGCKAQANLRGDIEIPPKVVIPNAFTPNGDGNNDYFKPAIIKDAKILFFRIYNRFGDLIFEGVDFDTNTPNSSWWDGKVNGVDAPMDVYVYVCNFTGLDGNSIRTLSDTFTLLR
jgi:gliding motility-associated-like protein